MRVGRRTRAGRPSRGVKVGASAGGGGGDISAFYVQGLNPDTVDFLNASDAGVSNGNTIFAVGNQRQNVTTSETTREGFRASTAPDSGTSVALFADDRYDTGGASDGAYGARQHAVTHVETYATGGNNDGIYEQGFSCVGIEVAGTWTATQLASAGEQATESNPSVASVPGGDGYDCLLVVAGWGADDYATTSDFSVTADVTPSWGTTTHEARHAFHLSYKSDSFVGLAPPSTDGITLTLATKGFAASGWKMRVFGLTST